MYKSLALECVFQSALTKYTKVVVTNNKKNGDYFDETEDCNDLKFDDFDVEVYDTLSKHSDIDPNEIPSRSDV